MTRSRIPVRTNKIFEPMQKTKKMIFLVRSESDNEEEVIETTLDGKLCPQV